MFQHEKQQYHDAVYWEQRYEKQPEQFDWYYAYEDLIPQLSFVLHKNHKVLCIGNGNSIFPVQLYDSFGITNIIASDISKVVTQQMNSKYNKQGLVFEVDDATSSHHASSSFDVVFDKGCTDALQTGAPELVQKVIDESHRLLKTGGYFLLISFGVPYKRLHLFDKEKWDVGIRKLKETEYNEEDYFCYFCKKIQ
ncbi:Endothelin-converting_enzyme 2 [Hexamita inflata]|uniref:Endothelin-converting enzyme 2 n=1 Tax=Hexamita inflata TaxID=28002 RepID=A0AA86PT19_9EUKA|nr:Endothelin-converting enzyme 2 [Hexamita inflata]CAI9965162.1 Endothelin-converting enzyme 2 [Hexamita inflata]